MRQLLPAAASLLLLTACPAEDRAAPPPPPAAPPPAPAPPTARAVTVLVTGHESGLLPLKAPRLLAQWKSEERWPDALAFSTGDAFSGQAISSHFLGEPTAEVMKALQYKAMALGNHELDLGLETLQAFQGQSGLAVLAANLKDKAGAERPLRLPGSAVFTREGLKVAVLGLTSPKTVESTVSGRAAGLELLPLAAAVEAALEGVAREKPDLVVALMDDCFPALQAVLAAHPAWHVDLVVGTRCEGAPARADGPTRYFSVGDDLSSYVSARFTLGPDGSRQLDARLKELPAAGPEDADLLALRGRWQARLDEALGQKIGFTRTGFTQDARELRTLVLTALRDETKADAALLNRRGIRAALPKGDITRASIYSLIPFENAVVTVKVKGEVLAKLRALPEAVLLLPPKLEPSRDYVLATTEYLFFGGDGLGLEAAAQALELTGQVWQTPVIRWLEKQQAGGPRPLEKLLR